MLSVITTALSTSMPTESMSPIIVRMFRDIPRKYMKPKVMINENGIARATIKVVESLRKKRYKTNTAKKAPHKPDDKSSSIEETIPSAALSIK